MTGQSSRRDAGRMEPGQDLVAVGFAGYDGTAAVVRSRYEELLAWFTKGYLDHILHDRSEEFWQDPEYLERWKPYGATEWEPAKEGGILTALWNLSGVYQTGIRFSLRKIPIRQETVEICERYDLNPYRLRSVGCGIFAADHGSDLAEALCREGIPAAVIGKVTTGIARLIDHGESVGYLERPAQDELYKIGLEITGNRRL